MRRGGEGEGTVTFPIAACEEEMDALPGLVDVKGDGFFRWVPFIFLCCCSCSQSQLCVVIGKMARFDWPRNWDALFPAIRLGVCVCVCVCVCVRVFVSVFNCLCALAQSHAGGRQAPADEARPVRAQRSQFNCHTTIGPVCYLRYTHTHIHTHRHTHTQTHTHTHTHTYLCCTTRSAL